MSGAPKSKAQLEREAKDAEKAKADAETAELKRAAKEKAKEKSSSKETKTKAQLEREARDAEKAKAEEEAAELKRIAKEKAKLEPPKPPKDTRTKAQKDKDEREDLKAMMGMSDLSKVPNSKTKSAQEQHNAAIKDGLEIFGDLSDYEPGEVADWFVTQVRKAGKADKGVESLALYKFAAAANSATDMQRQKIAKAAISGYGAMEAEDRAQVLTLVVQSAAAAQPGSKKDSQLVGNLRTIVKAARFDKMPDKEKEALIVTTQAQALEFANPQHLAEALKHMSEEERKQLSSSLVKTKLIPADQAALIEEIVQPDGILDEAGSASAAVRGAPREVVWAVVLLPLVEWFFAKRWLQTIDCTYDLEKWLHVDSCLSLAMVASVLITYKLLAPAYDILSSDPTGAMRRWQTSAAAGDDLDTRVQNTIRIGASAYRIGLATAVFSVFLALASGAYAAWAIFLLIGALTDMCVGPSVLFEAAVIALRFAFIAVVLYAVYRVYDLLQRHKLLGSGAADDASQPGYGSMDRAASADSKEDAG